MTVGELIYKIGVDDKGLSNGLDNASNKASSFGSKAKSVFNGAVAGVTAFVGATTAVAKVMSDNIQKTASYGDNVDKMSQKIGFSAEAYQKWDFVMQQNGASIESLKTGMKTLSSQVEKGNESFAKLGISETDLKNLNQEELFEKTVAGLQNMEAGTERTKIATELLGKAGADLGPLLNQTAQDTEALKQQAEDYGLVMSDKAVKASAKFSDSLNLLQQTSTGLKNRFMGEFLPSVTEVTDGLALLFTTSGKEEGLSKLTSGIEQTINKFGEMIPKVIEIATPIVTTIADAIIQNLPMLANTMTDLILNLGTYIIEALPKLIEIAGQILISLADGISKALPKLIPTIVSVVLTIVDNLINNIDKLLEASLQIIIALAEGLVDALPILLEKAPQLISALTEALINVIPLLIDAVLKLVNVLTEGIVTKTVELASNLRNKVEEIKTQLVQKWTEIKENIHNKVQEMKNAVIEKFHDLKTSAINKFTELKDTLEEKVKKFISIGRNIVDGIKDGISNAWSSLTSWFSEKIDALREMASDILGIHSPSKVFAEIGMFTGKGFENGLKSSFDSAYSFLDNKLDSFTDLTAPVTLTTSKSAPVNVGQQTVLHKFELVVNTPSDNEFARKLLPSIKLVEKESSYA